MGSSKQTTTTKNEIPAWMSSAGQDIYNKGLDVYNNSEFSQYDPSASIDTYLNPYTKNVVENTTNELLRANTLNNQATAAKATEAGAFGGSRHGLVEAENNRNTQQRIAEAADKAYSGAYDKANALGYSEFQRGQDYDQSQIKNLASLLGSLPHSTSSSSTSPGPNTAAQLGGGALALLGAFSDERLKENREPMDGEAVLAELRKMPIDSYDYKPGAQAALGLPEHRTGPMAQDYKRAFEGAEPGEGAGHEAAEGGEEPMQIDLADMMGKMLAAIKALDARTSGEESYA